MYLLQNLLFDTLADTRKTDIAKRRNLKHRPDIFCNCLSHSLSRFCSCKYIPKRCPVHILTMPTNSRKSMLVRFALICFNNFHAITSQKIFLEWGLIGSNPLESRLFYSSISSNSSNSPAKVLSFSMLSIQLLFSLISSMTHSSSLSE